MRPLLDPKWETRLRESQLYNISLKHPTNLSFAHLLARQPSPPAAVRLCCCQLAVGTSSFEKLFAKLSTKASPGCPAHYGCGNKRTWLRLGSFQLPWSDHSHSNVTPSCELGR